MLRNNGEAINATMLTPIMNSGSGSLPQIKRSAISVATPNANMICSLMTTVFCWQFLVCHQSDVSVVPNKRIDQTCMGKLFDGEILPKVIQRLVMIYITKFEYKSREKRFFVI
jgi:hypothetical protein